MEEGFWGILSSASEPLCFQEKGNGERLRVQSYYCASTLYLFFEAFERVTVKDVGFFFFPWFRDV